jgi:hypothetical protein
MPWFAVHRDILGVPPGQKRWPIPETRAYNSAAAMVKDFMPVRLSLNERRLKLLVKEKAVAIERTSIQLFSTFLNG